jgi:hypothetical protein
VRSVIEQLTGGVKRTTPDEAAPGPTNAPAAVGDAKSN